MWFIIISKLAQAMLTKTVNPNGRHYATKTTPCFVASIVPSGVWAIGDRLRILVCWAKSILRGPRFLSKLALGFWPGLFVRPCHLAANAAPAHPPIRRSTIELNPSHPPVNPPSYVEAGRVATSSRSRTGGESDASYFTSTSVPIPPRTINLPITVTRRGPMDA